MTATLAQTESPAARRRPAGWVLWRQWTLYMAIGELVGFAAPAAVMPVVTAGGLPEAATLAIAVATGAVEGTVLGLAQWLVLHRWLPHLSRRAWMLATALGAVLAYSVAMVPSTLGDLSRFDVAALAGGAVVLGLAFLASMGTAQWLVLRRHVERAGWWILANAVAWPLGVAVPFIAFPLLPEASPVGVIVVTGTVSGLLMGLVVAALTGIALMWLLRR